MPADVFPEAPAERARGSQELAQIAYLASEVADYRLGWLTELATALGQAAEVTLVVGGTSNLAPADLATFMAVGRIQLVGTGRQFVRRDKDGASSNTVFLNGRLLKTVLARRFDVLISEGYGRWSPYVLAARLLVGSRMVTSWERTAWTDRNNSRLRNAYYRMASPFSDLYLTNGIQSTGWAHERLARRMTVSPNYTCHPDFFAVPDMTTSTPTDPVRVLISARLVAEKGLWHFFDAASQHAARSQFDFHVVGSGPLRERLESLASSTPQLRMTMHGQKGRDFVLQLMTRTDLVLLPTLQDNWSLAVMEGIAAGRPVATTPYNGIAGDAARNGVNAFIFDPLDQSSNMKFLDDVLARRSDLSAMGQASRDIASDFRPESIAAKMAPLLLQLATTGRKL